jgi:hypothetical protein
MSKISYSMAISSGISVRAWPRKMESLLWESLRMDVLVPPPARLAELLDAPIRYKYRSSQPTIKGDGLVHTVYYAIGKQPYLLIIVSEERQEKRWLGNPRRFCHSGSKELVFRNGVSVLLMTLRNCHISKLVPPR